jgi:septum formation protein
MNGNPLADGGVESTETPGTSRPLSSGPAPTPLILAADTVVWYGGRIFGKPRDESHAQRILTALRGETHQVYTGICLRHGDKYHVAHEATSVRFRTVSDEWITRYIASGEPMDKAGAYAAQGRGAMLIERIEGDFWNVVGLPLGCLGRLLESLGAPVETWWS